MTPNSRLGTTTQSQRTASRNRAETRLHQKYQTLMFGNSRMYSDYMKQLQMSPQEREDFYENEEDTLSDKFTPPPDQAKYGKLELATSFTAPKPPKPSKNKKMKHPIVECEGCGNMMNMNDPQLQCTVITFTIPCMEESPFFFHDEICINLRRYKEAIRKSDLAQNKNAVRPPLRNGQVDDLWNVGHLVANYNKLIGVKGSIPLPRPVDPFAAEFSTKPSLKSFLVKTVTSRSLRSGTKTTKKGPHSNTSSKDLGLDESEDDEGGYEDDVDLRIIRQQREIACIFLWRNQNRDQNEDSGDKEFDSIPLEIQYCDSIVYGVALWEFVMQQLLTKQTYALWLLLAYFSKEIPTITVIDLMQAHIADIAKVKDLEHLELVCSSVIANSEYPIATALHLSRFVTDLAADDLSRKDEFKEIAERYTIVAESLVENIESDHLLSILLEVPTDLNLMSVFEIAITYEMSNFFDNNRVDRIMGHMWSQFDFLDPRVNFRTAEIDLYELLEFLFLHPAKFYFSPVGRYYIQGVMYMAYVGMITYVMEQQQYLYGEVPLVENLMWIFNAGYALYELMEMTFRGIEYFSDSTNYFDMAIMLNWAILGFMRLVVHTDQHGECSHDSDAECRGDARNSNSTTVYMTLFAVQIIILYCRIATIFSRSKELGPFIRMIGGMIDDIANFIFVTLIFFLGFVQALRYVVAQDVGSDVCGDDADLEADLDTWYAVVLYVFVTLMGQQEW